MLESVQDSEKRLRGFTLLLGLRHPTSHSTRALDDTEKHAVFQWVALKHPRARGWRRNREVECIDRLFETFCDKFLRQKATGVTILMSAWGGVRNVTVFRFIPLLSAADFC